MPRVSDLYLESKQQQILDAAIRCFAVRGFDATTIEDICREAGVSHGAVYRYFQSKEDIVEASFRREVEARLARYTAVMQQDDARRVLEDWVSLYFKRRAEPEPDIMVKFRMQLYGESVRNPKMGEIQRQGRGVMLNRAAAIIRRAQNRGEISPHVDPIALARVCAAITDGLYVQKSVTPDMDVGKCMEAVRAIFFGNLWLTHKQEDKDGNKAQQPCAQT